VSFDLVVRGGRVADGTGLPSFTADVGIRAGRIAKVGRIAAPAARTIDADGAWVTPGFIDVHTHYDVQLDWDPWATPSCWHGVTTVLAGNCGFTLAPAHPADIDWLAGMLSRVEGMSRAALAAGLAFHGGGFGEYWQRFDDRLGVNVGSFVGHSAVRRWVMGEAASERPATTDEIAAMADLVRQAMRQGAIGFSTSQLDIHVGEDGREVPSNHATAAEIVALAGVLAEFERGAVEIIPRSFAEGYDAADRDLLMAIYRTSGRPVELNLLLPTPHAPMGWQATLEFVRHAWADGVRLHPQFATNALGLHLNLADTFVFDEMPAWRAVLTLPEPERSRRLADPTVRAAMQTAWDDPRGRAVSFEWADLEVETVSRDAHRDRVGRTVTELAAARGTPPLDVFLDVSLEDDLRTQWRTRLSDVARSFVRHVTAAGIAEPVVMAGSSDGGAHLGSFVGADYTTRLLAEWVPEPLAFEQAVWRLAGMPAAVHALADRGFVREGAWADLLVIDPSQLAAGAARRVRDFPAATERYVTDAEGYAAVLVNGEPILERGASTGALPGHVIRGG
jgi:N-acyl-D-aspartate/D-glutamate deacylase